jgi:hypothetical protein
LLPFELQPTPVAMRAYRSWNVIKHLDSTRKWISSMLPCEDTRITTNFSTVSTEQATVAVKLWSCDCKMHGLNSGFSMICSKFRGECRYNALKKATTIIYQIHLLCYLPFFYHIRRFVLLAVCIMQLKYCPAITLESVSAKTLVSNLWPLVPLVNSLYSIKITQ